MHQKKQQPTRRRSATPARDGGSVVRELEGGSVPRQGSSVLSRSMHATSRKLGRAWARTKHGLYKRVFYVDYVRDLIEACAAEFDGERQDSSGVTVCDDPDELEHWDETVLSTVGLQLRIRFARQSHHRSGQESSLITMTLLWGRGPFPAVLEDQEAPLVLPPYDFVPRWKFAGNIHRRREVPTELGSQLEAEFRSLETYAYRCETFSMLRQSFSKGDPKETPLLAKVLLGTLPIREVVRKTDELELPLRVCLRQDKTWHIDPRIQSLLTRTIIVLMLMLNAMYLLAECT